MNAETQSEARRPRVNPFVFPSDTDFRFALLVVSVVFAASYVFWVLFDEFANTPLFGDIGKIAIRCMVARSAILFPKIPAFLGSLAHPEQEFSAETYIGPDFSFQDISTPYDQCVNSYGQLQSLWTLGGEISLLLLALALYWTEPWRKMRRERLQALEERDAPDVFQALMDLSHEAGLRHVPIFVWSPLNPIPTGQAFGRWGKYYVALTGGLVSQFYVDPRTFRAILRHELAHLRNADVDKTYFALASWQAFVMVALVPLAAQGLYSLIFDPRDFVDLSLMFFPYVLVLATAVYLMRNSILRAREKYADVRASIWDGPDGALTRVIDDLKRAPRAFWKQFLLLHPDARNRLQAVADPRHLMQVDFWSFLGAGFTATIGYRGSEAILQYVFSKLTGTTGTTMFAVLISALMLSAFVGLILWRDAFSSRIERSRPHRIGLPSLGLTLGLELGSLISFGNPNAFPAVGPSQSNPFAAVLTLLLAIATYVIGSVLLWSAIYLLLKWMIKAVSVWLEGNQAPSDQWAVIVASISLLGLLLTYFIGMFLQIQATVYRGGGFPAIMLGLQLEYGFLMYVTLLIPLSLSVFPLLAHFSQRRTPTAIPDWAYLDKVNTPAVFPEYSSLRPGYASLAGFLSAIAYTALLLFLRIVVHTLLPETIRSTDLFKLVFFGGTILLAGLMQAITGFIVYHTTKHLKMEHAILAALIGGLVMAVGFLIANLLFGGGAQPDVVLTVINSSIKTGFGLTLLIVLASLAAGTIIGALRPRTSIRLPHESPG